MQYEHSAAISLRWAQGEVDPHLGDETSRISPLKRSTGPFEAEDFLPFGIQQVNAMSLFDQPPRLMSTPSSAVAAAHELSPSTNLPKSTVTQS